MKTVTTWWPSEAEIEPNFPKACAYSMARENLKGVEVDFKKKSFLIHYAEEHAPVAEEYVAIVNRKVPLIYAFADWAIFLIGSIGAVLYIFTEYGTELGRPTLVVISLVISIMFMVLGTQTSKWLHRRNIKSRLGELKVDTKFVGIGLGVDVKLKRRVGDKLRVEFTFENDAYADLFKATQDAETLDESAMKSVPKKLEDEEEA